MNKFKNLLIVILLAAVVLLGAVVLRLSRSAPAASGSDTDRPSGMETDADTGAEPGTDGGAEAEDPGDQNGEMTADLNCSVQLGSLRIIRGEDFGILEGDAGDCEAYLDNGVYTVSAGTTRDTPIVVTVPEDVRFEDVTLTASGGSLAVENLDAEDLTTTCEQGTLRFSGCVSGDVSVEHLQGETVLELDGDASGFNYELSYEMGHIELGKQSYAGARGSESIDNGCGKTIRVHCAMGSVGILFPEES